MPNPTTIAAEQTETESRAAAPRVFPGNGLVALCEEPEAIEREVWFIWNKYGHPPHFAHPTEELANAEAQRLAAKHPGKSFLVMRSMRKFRVEPAVADSAEAV